MKMKILLLILGVVLLANASEALSPQFSFNYDGKPFAVKPASASKKLDKNRTQRTLTYTDLKLSLIHI